MTTNVENSTIASVTAKTFGGKAPEWLHFDFPDRLRKIRRHAGLSQSEFAEVIGFNKKTIALWEASRQTPRDIVQVAKRINKEFPEIPLWWLLSLEDPNKD